MKKIITIMMICLTLLSLGCQTKKSEEVTAAELDMPDWALNPPKAEGSIYGIGLGETSRQDISLKVARARARVDIAAQLKSQVQSALVDYFQEAGMANDLQSVQYIEYISKEIINEKIEFTTTEKTYPTKAGGFWVLVSYPIDKALSDFEEVATEFERNESAAFAEFKAEEALKFLDNQLSEDPTTSNPVSE